MHDPPRAALTTRWTDTTVQVPLGLVHGLFPSAILTSSCTSTTLVTPSPLTSHGDNVGGGGGGKLPLSFCPSCSRAASSVFGFFVQLIQLAAIGRMTEVAKA